MAGKGKAALRRAGKSFLNSGTEHGIGLGTDRAGGRVHCRYCGHPVRSSLGDVCHKPRCHRRAVLAEED
jgi:hypothetical protein